MTRTNRTSTKCSSKAADVSADRLPPSDEQKPLENKLGPVGESLRAVFDWVPVMIWDCERGGKIRYANRYAAEALGLSAEQLVGKTYDELFTEEAEQTVRAAQKVSRSHPSLSRQRGTLRTANGVRWVLAERISYQNAKGELAGEIIFAHDITEQKAAETQLQQADRQLRAAAQRIRILAEEAAGADRAKSEFLVHLSRQLRTPVNSILGFAEILHREEQDEEHRQYIQMIQRSAEALLSLVQNILDFVKIEAGKVPIQLVPCRCADIVKDVFDVMSPAARSRGLDFTWECSPHLPELIYTDPMRLRQCLLNLLSNAVQFTEQGRVAVRVYPEVAAGQNRIRFDVEDTGIGIEPSRQNLIFESFTQAEHADGRPNEGTGLGLAITRRLTGLLGGHMELSSQPGKGSTFSLILPSFVEPMQNTAAADPSRSEAAAAEDERHIGCIGRILLLEDHPPRPVQASLLLRRAGLEVEVVQTLQEALERLRRVSCHLVLVALETVSEARKAAARLRDFDEHLPIVVITSDSSRKAAEQFRIAGSNAVLVEPVSRIHLYETLRSFLSVQAASAVRQDFLVDESADTLVERLPAMMEQMMESYARSDYEVLSEYAKVLADLGEQSHHSLLLEKARCLGEYLSGGVFQPDELHKQVEELNELCLQISLGR